jgi:sugar phosphate isomerase/epimerase
MKLGACIKTGIKDDQLKEFEEFNAEFVETSVSEVKDLSEAQFNAFVDLLKKHHFKSEVQNVFFPEEVKLTGPARDEGKIKDYLDFVLPRAHKLGTENIVFGSGPARRVPEGFPRDEAWKQLIADLKIISDKIRPFGIRIVIEPLNTGSCNIVNSVAEGYKLAKDVNLDNILLLADYYHMMKDDEPASHLIDYGSIIKHIHISERDRFFPRERGSDFDLFFETIKKSGYNERISCEGKTNDIVKDTRTALAVMRTYLGE